MPHTLGDLVVIDDQTVLVLGQELDVGRDQPDVGNAVVHRAGTTLVLVDTGVTPRFRTALRHAIDRVGPWERLLVLTTHGHPDHVGNNDIADEIAAERGISVQHWIPARDVPMMRDPAAYWDRSFRRIPEVTPLAAPPSLAGRKVSSLFQPMRPFGSTTRSYEEMPLEQFTIGTTRATGWSLAEGMIRVYRSQGHCAGHVVVHLLDSRILHISDEGNGPCGVMHDADQLKLHTALGLAAAVLEDGQADVLTDGHTFDVRRGPEATQHVETLLEQAVQLTRIALRAAPGGPVPVRTFADAYSDAAADIGYRPANVSPIFAAMMAVNQLGEIGYRPIGTGAHWDRPELITPPAVNGPLPTGIAALPALLSLFSWRARRRDRR